MEAEIEEKMEQLKKAYEEGRLNEEEAEIVAQVLRD